MKIAWLSSWPPCHCGIATYSKELVDALQHEGCEVHIICHTDGGAQDQRAQRNLPAGTDRSYKNLYKHLREGLLAEHSSNKLAIVDSFASIIPYS